MAGGAIESGRSVASRVAAILMAFGSGGTHSLTELAGLAGLPISTTHRLVGELVSRRVLERTEGGGYRVGLPLRMIGGISFPSPPPLLDRALEVLVEGEAKGKWYGRTRTNKLVHIQSPEPLAGQVVEARITQTSPWSLQGELLVPALA